MSDAFRCTRCDRSEPTPLARAPMPTELGERVRSEICEACWEEWKKHQMTLINHYGLRLQEPEAREFLYAQLGAFLFGEGTAAPEVDPGEQGSVRW